MSDGRQNHLQKSVEDAKLRKRAEEEVKMKQLPSLSAQTPEAIQQIIHELRVHQIELEMQNEELRKAQDQIEDARLRYFDLYDLAPVGYCTISEKGLILETNLTLATMLDANRGQMIKKPFSAFIIGGDQDIYYMFRKLLLNTDKAQSCELRMAKKDTTTFWASLHAMVNQDEGYTKSLRVTITDITRQKRLERDLRNAELSAQKASQAKRLFLANMSHELRTPLNGIIGFSDILRTTPLDEQQKEFLDIVFSSAKHLNEVISDILDFSKIEANKLELSPEKTNLRKLIDETCSIVQFMAKSKGLPLNQSIEARVPEIIYVDGPRLRQNLVNLLTNAVKFTDEGCVHLSVSLQERRGDKICLLFKVTDTGIGIKDKELIKIFDPFHQADMSLCKRIQGTGLGLSITKNLLEKMGSSLQLKSVYGKGSTFYFELSVSSEKEQVVSLKQTSDAINAEPDYLKNIKVLIAEDNPVNMNYAKTALSMFSEDIEIIEAENGKDAYKLFLEHAPDIILMDVVMPEIDGYQATAMIRNRNEKVPIIAMTARALIDDKDGCLAAGMDDYIAKPVSLNVLKEILKKYI